MTNPPETKPPQPPGADSPEPSNGGGGGSLIHSFPTLLPLILGCTFLFCLLLSILLLWLHRRRSRAKAKRARGGGGGGAGGPELVLSSRRPSAEDDDKKDGMEVTVEMAQTSTRRRLQKACSIGAGPGWWSREGSGLVSDDEDGEGRGWPKRRVSMPPLIPRACEKGHFHFGRCGSCRWPGTGGSGGAKGENQESVEMGKVVVDISKASWIDEDAVHGPKLGRSKTVGGGGGGRKKMTLGRGSWPLRGRSASLSRVGGRAGNGHPYLMSGARGGGESTEALLLEKKQESPRRLPATITQTDHLQLGTLGGMPTPTLPKPVVIAQAPWDRRAGGGLGVRRSASMGYGLGTSKASQSSIIISPATSPTRSTPMTPKGHRARQASVDSTLSEILRSTEQRLREGSVSGTTRAHRFDSSPTRVPPGLAAERSRTPSPRKVVSNPVFMSGHRRTSSQQSVSSETVSGHGSAEDSVSANAAPTGLTSPSRNHKIPDITPQLPPVTASARTSMSSDLSTLYSEDEMPEEVKRAIMPNEALQVKPQEAASVQPPSLNDPFTVDPLPLSAVRETPPDAAWPTQASKSQGILRQTAQPATRLRSMTAFNSLRPQVHGLIFVPGPPPAGPRPVPPSTRKISLAIPPPSGGGGASQTSGPLSASPTRKTPTSHSPAGPLFLRLTKTSTLSTIPLLSPPSAPGTVVKSVTFKTPVATLVEPSDDESEPEEQERKKAKKEQEEDAGERRAQLPSTERDPSSSSQRTSLALPPPLKHRLSVSSSVYSQDPSPTTTTPAPSSSLLFELNRAGFLANSSLYPAPLSPRGKPKLSTELETPPDSTSSKNSNNNPDTTSPQDTSTTGPETQPPPTTLTNAVVSLRRMNSTVSSASSLQSITDRHAPPDDSRSPSPSPDWSSNNSSPKQQQQQTSPERVVTFAPSAGAPKRISPFSSPANNRKNNNSSKLSGSPSSSPASIAAAAAAAAAKRASLASSSPSRKSIGVGARNYFLLGQQQSSSSSAACIAVAGGRSPGSQEARSSSTSPRVVSALASSSVGTTTTTRWIGGVGIIGGSKPAGGTIPSSASGASLGKRRRLGSSSSSTATTTTSITHAHLRTGSSSGAGLGPTMGVRFSHSEVLSALSIRNDEGKENDTTRGEGNKFKLSAGDFPFQLNKPSSLTTITSADNNSCGDQHTNTGGKTTGLGLGLREGSCGSINAQPQTHHHQQKQQKDPERLSTVMSWKFNGGSENREPAAAAAGTVIAARAVREGGNPSRASLRSVDSLGLYDGQGFLISMSPVKGGSSSSSPVRRRGVSPSGLRV
ncbi:hypothetical protein VTJ04DRAFT_6250 [Mycothermus thermophilus]|uniref:uncharacterized protein n=1 Tax=Humicola insolens TaxID=85995 RepID=UPI00374289DC